MVHGWSRWTAAGLILLGLGVRLAPPLLGAACTGAPPKAFAAEPIVIGVSLGLTNDLASSAVPLRDAVRAAEGEINASGGLLGRQVRFDVVDDRSDEGDGVVKVIQAFADRKVAAVIGPLGSGQVKATQQILAGKQILQITPTATSVELSDIQPADNRFLFRTTPADDFQGAAVILFATKTPRGLGDAGAVEIDGGPPTTCTKLALVFIDNSYGTSMAKVITDNFPKRGPGRAIVIQKKIPLETAPSYAAEVASIIPTQPECLALIAYEKAAAQFVRDLKANPGYSPLAQKGFFIIGTDGVYTQGFLDLSRTDQANPASPSTAEGVYGTNPDTQPGTPQYNAFRTIYSSYFPLRAGDDAPAFTANTFDAAMLVALAIEKAGNVTDRIAIREALRTVSSPGGRPIGPSEIAEGLLELRSGGDIDYEGASGNVNFAPNGNVTSGFIVWQAVRDDQNKVVYKTLARFDTDSLLEQLK
jgi:ABC-type branched-subunit amino acid transport system substrate-binding protein